MTKDRTAPRPYIALVMTLPLAAGILALVAINRILGENTAWDVLGGIAVGVGVYWLADVLCRWAQRAGYAYIGLIPVVSVLGITYLSGWLGSIVFGDMGLALVCFLCGMVGPCLLFRWLYRLWEDLDERMGK